MTELKVKSKEFTKDDPNPCLQALEDERLILDAALQWEKFRSGRIIVKQTNAEIKLLNEEMIKLEQQVKII